MSLLWVQHQPAEIYTTHSHRIVYLDLHTRTYNPLHTFNISPHNKKIFVELRNGANWHTVMKHATAFISRIYFHHHMKLKKRIITMWSHSSKYLLLSWLFIYVIIFIRFNFYIHIPLLLWLNNRDKSKNFHEYKLANITKDLIVTAWITA